MERVPGRVSGRGVEKGVEVLKKARRESFSSVILPGCIVRSTRFFSNAMLSNGTFSKVAPTKSK